MSEFFANLFSTDGFVARRSCGVWSDGHIWLHTTSDLLIWLAYLSIPLILGTFLWKRRRDLPFRALIALFAAFILACGFTHLLDALMFVWPAYRLSGLVKGVTAVVSWLTVAALIPAVPRVLAFIDNLPPAAGGWPSVPAADPGRPQRYVVAAGLAGISLLLRFAGDSVLSDGRGFVLPLLAVMAASWYGGFWPGLLALALGGGGFALLFVDFKVEDAAALAPQADLALFVFCGVAAAALGQAQRSARLAADAATADLHESNRQLAHSQWDTTEALTQLNAFLTHAPVGLAFFDPELRFLRVNRYLAEANGRSEADHMGKTVPEVLPDFPADVLADYEEVLASGKPLRDRVVTGVTGSDSVWHVNAYPARDPHGIMVGLAVVAQNVTDRVRQERAIQESEARFRTLTEAVPGFIWSARPDGQLDYHSRRVQDYSGRPAAELLGDGWADIVHPADRPRAAERWAAALATGEPYQTEFRLRRADGAYRWHAVQALAQRAGPTVEKWVGYCADVHEQRAAAESLAASEARFRATADAAPAVLWETDPAGHCTFISRGWYELTGQPEGEGLGLGWLAMTHPDDAGPAGEAFHRANDARGTFQVDYRVRRADGEYRWATDIGRPRFGPAGEYLGMVGSVIDIDDRKRAEDEVRQAGDRLRQITDTVPAFIALVGPDGRYRLVNRAYEEQFGRPRAELVGRHVREVLGEARWAAAEPLLARALAGEVVGYDSELPGPDGGVRSLVTTYTPKLDPAGGVRGVVVSAMDVTARKRAEAAVRASEGRYRTLFESMDEGFCVAEVAFDPTGRATDHRILEANPAFETHTGLRGMVGKSVREAVPGIEEFWHDTYGRVATTGEPARFVHQAKPLDDRWFDVSVSRLGGPGSNKVAVLFNDITARKRAEADLQRANDELEQRVADRTAELRREKAFLGAVLESVEDAIVACDADGTLTLFNRATKQLHGLPAAPVPTDRWADHYSLFGPDGKTPLGRAEVPLYRALAGEQVRDAEMVVAPRGAGPRTLLASGRALFDEDGRRLGAVVSMHDITDRRAAEAARAELVREQTLRQGEARFRLLADAMPQIVYVTRPDSTPEYLNRRWYEYTGLADDTQESIQSAVHPDDRPRVAERYAGVAPGDDFEIEFRLRRHDGAYRWFLTRSTAVRDDAGQVVNRFGTSTDIDDQKRTEEALRAGEADLRQAQRVAQVGNWRWDAVADVVTGSDELYRIYGLDPAAGFPSLAEQDGTLYPHDAWVRVSDAVHHTAATGEAVEFDVPALRGRTEPIWVSVRTEAERNPDGRVTTLRGTVQDITARKRAEAELAAVTVESDRLRRLYETVLSATPDFVYVFSLDHRVLYANTALIEMWGRGREGAIGKTFREIGYEPWHADLHDREIDQVRATRQPIRGEVPFTGTLGRRIYDYIFVPVLGPDGEVEAVAGTTRDVTERKEAEDRLRAGEERYRTLLESLSDGFVVLDREFRHTYMNAAAERLNGQRREEVLGRTQWEAYPACVGTVLEREFRRAMDEGVTVEFENHYQPWDRWFALKAYPAADGGISVQYRDVTASKRAEAAARAAEERFAFIRRSSGVGFWYCDLPFDVLEWDERVKAHFHLPPDATVTIDTFYDRIHPDDREPTRRAIAQSIADHTAYDTVYRTVAADGGAVKWVRAVGRTAYGPDGAPTQFDGITIDVTAAQQAAAALRESEANARLALDVARLGTWRFYPADGRIEADARTRDIMGYPAAGELGLADSLARTHPDDRAAVEAAVAAAVGRADGRFAVEHRVVHPGGGERWVSGQGLVESAGDQPAVIRGTVQDVTERRAAEAALRASEEQRRLALDAAELGTWNIDPDAGVLVSDERFQIIFTGRPGPIGYERAFDRIHPDDRGRVRDAVAAAIRPDDPAAYAEDYRVVHGDGAVRWASARGRASFAGDGPARRLVSFDGTVADITDRKRSEEQLATSEARFRGLADTAPQIVWEAAPDGRLTFLSRFFTEYAGQPADAALGEAERWGQVIRPDHLARVAANWADAVAGAGRYEDLFPVRRADGLFRWFQSRGRLVRHADGTPDRWVGTATDVHDRVAAEEALAATQRTLTMALATANAGVFTWDVAADRFTLRLADPNNPGYLAISRPQTYAQTMATIHPDDRERVRAAVERSRATRGPFAESYRVGSRDAGWRWLEGRGQFEYAADGTPLRMVGVRMDVHERKAAEEAARQADLEFRAMADSIPQLAWMTRPDGHIDWYNSRWYEYTGTTFEDMQGWGWERVHDPAELQRMLPGWKAALAAGTPFEDTFPLRGADGTFRWFLTRARPIRDDAGDVVRWFGTNTDVTAQRQLEADLRAAGDRFRFLDALGQATRDTDPRATLAATTRRLGEHLRATRCAYADMHPDGDHFTIPHDWTDGAESTVGDYSLALFGPKAVADLNANRPLVVRDVDAELGPAGGADMFNAIGIKAIICCPLVKGGRLVALMAVHQATPRDWTPAEIGLVTEVVERSWAHVERAKAEDEALAAAGRFRTLTEAIPQLVWNADADGRVNYVNDRWREYTGRDAAGSAADWWEQVAHPADAPAVAEAWTKVLTYRRPDPVKTELRLRRAADGAYRWFSMGVVPLARADGSVDQWIGSLSDVHDLKVAEEATRASEARFRNLVEAVPNLVWVTDADGHITQLNRQWVTYTGRQLDDIMGDGWASLLHPDDAAGVVTGWQAAVRHRAAYAGEFRFRTASGEYRWQLARGIPVPGPDGRLSQWFGTTTDIDGQKRAAELLESQVKERTAELHRSNGELEKFAYVASHDLQEPLRKVRAFGDRLATKFAPGLGQDGKDYIERMQASAARMQTLIDDLLAFARVASKPKAFVPVPLNRVVDGVLSDLEALTTRSGATVTVGELPTVLGEAPQWRQLFQNLIANACKFARPGHPPTVAVAASRLETLTAADPPSGFAVGWRLTVSDDGIGFEQQYAERIFEVFQRLHGRGQYEGTGIGLAICRKIVERHGGIITARGRPGEGAVFAVDLPDPPGETPQ